MMLDIVYIFFHIMTISTLGFMIIKYLKVKKYVSIIKHKLQKMDINVDDFLDELIEEPKTESNKEITAIGPNKPTNTKFSDPALISVYRQRIAEVISAGNSKEYLGKQITLDQLAIMSDTELMKCFAIYESKLGSKMTKSLGQSILSLYSASVSHFFSIDDQEKLANDLANDPLISSSLGGICSYLYFSYGPILAPLATAVITYSHIKNNKNKNDSNIVLNDRIEQQTE